MCASSKTVGHEVAISTILETTRVALASVDLSSKGDVYDLAGALGRRQIFNKVWLGLAGIGHQSDVDAFAPLVCKALNIAEGDEDALRITNGECLALHIAQITELSCRRRWTSSGLSLRYTTQYRLDHCFSGGNRHCRSW